MGLIIILKCNNNNADIIKLKEVCDKYNIKDDIMRTLTLLKYNRYITDEKAIKIDKVRKLLDEEINNKDPYTGHKEVD